MGKYSRKSAMTALFWGCSPMDHNIGRSPAIGEAFDRWSEAETAMFLIKHMPLGS
jgi:hypothetical protein